MAPTPTIQSWQSSLQGKIHPAAAQAISLLFGAIQDHDTAIVSLNGKVTTATASATSTASAASSTSTATSGSSFPNLGIVNSQTGVTYGTQLTDNGSLLVMSNAAAMSITLTSTVTAPFFMSILNLGGANAVLTPSSGKINNAASITVLSAGWAILYFDGINWWSLPSPVLPVTTAAVAHQWLASYNASTGAFTQSQPAFADISGQITPAQLPSSGLSATITTAALTSVGTQGSMTFTNGLLTAQAPAT